MSICSYVAKPKALIGDQRDVLEDAPLTRAPKSGVWVGTHREWSAEKVVRLIDKKFLTLDIDKDPFGRTATLTDEGKQILLAE